MKTRAWIMGVLLGMGCAPQGPLPPPSGTGLVTLGTFEGEVDPDAGTFVIRSTGAATAVGPAGAHPMALAIAEGASTVTIGNNGTPTQEAGSGSCAGFTVLAAPVRITRGTSNTGFVGGLYAEILSISGTGGEACNSDAAPAGLSSTRGLWSYGEVRTGATTADRTWYLKVTSGQKTTFSGQIVGVPGTTFAVTTDMPVAYSNPDFRNPVIAYTRGQMAYATSSGKIVYVNLDGSHASSVTLPGSEGANSLAFYTGATSADDLLWFTTNTYVGVVYGGTVYSVAGGTAPLASAAVDPGTQNRAWFISRGGTYIRPVDFVTSTHLFTLGSTTGTAQAGYSLAIGPATSPATGNRIYLTNGGWLKIFTLAGVADGSLSTAASLCSNSYGILLGPDGKKLWWVACQSGCAFCSYDTSTGTYERFTQSLSGSAVCFAKSATSSSTVPWGIDVDAANHSPAVSNLTQLVAGSGSARISVDYLDTTWPTSVASAAGSPAVTVGATDHPAYLWVTTGNGLLRMQP